MNYVPPVSSAVLIPYRYGNQPEVAQGLKKAFSEIPGLRREDVFIVRTLL